MLSELRTENARKQAIVAAIGTASQALEKMDFHGGLEALQSVRRAYGDSEDLNRVISDYEARRTAVANEGVSKSVEAARGALLRNDAAAALNELQGSASLVEFAGTLQQADWRRLRAEAAKPPARRPTGAIDTGVAVEESPEAAAQPQRGVSPKVIALIAGGLGLVAVLVLVFWLLNRGHQPTTANQPATPSVPAAPAAPPTGTLNVEGNMGDVNVFVDGVLKGFTQSDGKLSLPLDEGTHTVRFTKAGYEDFQAPPIAISANKEAGISFKLNQSAGAAPPPPTEAYLTVHSSPGASVSIDNAPIGRTDTRGDLIVPVKPGRRAIQVRLDNFQTFSQSVTVKAGEKKPLNASLIAMAAKPAPAPAPAPAAPAPSPVQIQSFSASSSQIEQGQSTTLKWETANASDVTIDNGIDRVDSSGQTTVRPTANTTYTLTAKGNGGTQQRSLNILVEARPVAPAVSAPTPTPVPHVDDKALLKQLVREFEGAFNSHDTGRVKSVWVGMNSEQSKLLQGLFKSNPEARVKEECPDSSLSIQGDHAQWACTEVTSIKSSGKLTDFPRKQTLSFAKKGDSWYLSDKY
jgi:PEGA domain